LVFTQATRKKEDLQNKWVYRLKEEPCSSRRYKVTL